MVPDDLEYVSQLNNVLFDGRLCLSKMIRVEGPVCDVSAATAANAEIKNTWITPPVPPFFAALCVIQQCDKLKFTFLFRPENACLEDCTNWKLSFYRVNLLKPTGYVMHHQFNIQQLYALPTLYLCVLCSSENKQRLVPLTA